MADVLSAEEKIMALKVRYLSSLPEKMSDILHAWQNFHHSAQLEDNPLQNMLHKLAGSAGLYDEAPLGDKAREIEQLVAGPASELSPETTAQIDAMLQSLAAMVNDICQQ